MAEALGFAEAGKAKDLMRGGAFDIDGSIPINTGGGLVGFGHPVGATGIKQVKQHAFARPVHVEAGWCDAGDDFCRRSWRSTAR